MLQELRELVGRRLLPLASRAQLFEPLAERVRRLRVVVDVVAERRLERELRRRMAPAGDALEELDLQVPVVREPALVLPDGEAPA